MVRNAEYWLGFVVIDTMKRKLKSRAFRGLGKNAEEAPGFALTLGGKRGTDVHVRGMQSPRNCFPPTLWRTSGRGVFSTAAVFPACRQAGLLLSFASKERRNRKRLLQCSTETGIMHQDQPSFFWQRAKRKLQRKALTRRNIYS